MEITREMCEEAIDSFINENRTITDPTLRSVRQAAATAYRLGRSEHTADLASKALGHLEDKLTAKFKGTGNPQAIRTVQTMFKLRDKLEPHTILGKAASLDHSSEGQAAIRDEQRDRSQEAEDFRHYVSYKADPIRN